MKFPFLLVVVALYSSFIFCADDVLVSFRDLARREEQVFSFAYLIEQMNHEPFTRAVVKRITDEPDKVAQKRIAMSVISQILAGIKGLQAVVNDLPVGDFHPGCCCGILYGYWNKTCFGEMIDVLGLTSVDMLYDISGEERKRADEDEAKMCCVALDKCLAPCCDPIGRCCERGAQRFFRAIEVCCSGIRKACCLCRKKEEEKKYVAISEPESTSEELAEAVAGFVCTLFKLLDFSVGRWCSEESEEALEAAFLKNYVKI